MPTILLETIINAPIDRCYDLARSIELHQDGAGKTKEKAIHGITSGLIDLGESVTWRAKHFGIWQKLKVQIIETDRPKSFTDVMIKGTFKTMKHVHSFEANGNTTIMTDNFTYESPLYVLGRLADRLFLKKYMTEFLIHKNEVFKEVLESKEWQKYLKTNDDGQI